MPLLESPVTLIEAFDGHRWDSPQKLGSHRTHRWREQDSNHRSLSGTLPGPAHARLPNAARTLCLGAVAQELPLHRVHLGDICRDVVVTAAFAGD
jgi:hypothetical protein